jgi:hypothetical protein
MNIQSDSSDRNSKLDQILIKRTKRLKTMQASIIKQQKSTIIIQ